MSLPTVNLDEVAAVNPRVSDRPDDETTVSFLGMADVDASTGTTSVGEGRRFGDVYTGYTQFIDGDLLIAKITPCFENGKIVQTTLRHPRGAGSTEFHVVRPNPERVDARFLLHFLRQPYVRLTGEMRMTGSAGQRRVPDKFIRQLNVPHLPMSKQRRIVQVLDQVDALRVKRRETIALLDELIQSIFLDMFGDPEENPMGWDSTGFTEIVDGSLRNGLSPSKGGAVVAQVLTLSAITGNHFDPTAFKTATFNEKPPASQSVKRGNFLICRGNGNINLVGRGQFPYSHMPDMTFPDTIIAAQIPNEISRSYLEQVWNSRFVRRQIERSARTTNGTFKVNQRALGAVKILLPPTDLQWEFDERVASLSDLRQQHLAHLAELDSLFASLQHRAFLGELWDDTSDSAA